MRGKLSLGQVEEHPRTDMGLSQDDSVTYSGRRQEQIHSHQPLSLLHCSTQPVYHTLTSAIRIGAPCETARKPNFLSKAKKLSIRVTQGATCNARSIPIGIRMKIGPLAEGSPDGMLVSGTMRCVAKNMSDQYIAETTTESCYNDELHAKTGSELIQHTGRETISSTRLTFRRAEA